VPFQIVAKTWFAEPVQSVPMAMHHVEETHDTESSELDIERGTGSRVRVQRPLPRTSANPRVRPFGEVVK
jgi:hypothetical protein